MAFMIFLSTTWFRAKIYEPFLLIHIAMGIITIAALFWLELSCTHPIQTADEEDSSQC
jgi:hypothetical protein